MRARNIKPGFFENEDLAEIALEGRIIFMALWCLADREGRLEDRPKRIAKKALPYDDCDGEAMMQALHDGGFIIRYEVDGVKYIQVVNFLKHQNPHHNESPSQIPAPEGYEPVPKRVYKKKTTDTGQAPEQAGTRPVQDQGLPDKNIVQDQGLSEKNPVHAPVMDKSTFIHGEKTFIHGRKLSRTYRARFSDSLIPRFLDSKKKDLKDIVPASAGTSSTEQLSMTEDPYQGVSEHDRLILQTLRGVEQYKFDFKKDLAFIHRLQTDYPDINVLAVAIEWSTDKLDHPLTAKNSPRRQFRTWCHNQSNWAKERGAKGGQARQPQGLARNSGQNREDAGGIPKETGLYAGIGRRMPTV